MYNMYVCVYDRCKECLVCSECLTSDKIKKWKKCGKKVSTGSGITSFDIIIIIIYQLRACIFLYNNNNVFSNDANNEIYYNILLRVVYTSKKNNVTCSTGGYSSLHYLIQDSLCSFSCNFKVPQHCRMSKTFEKKTLYFNVWTS